MANAPRADRPGRPHLQLSTTPYTTHFYIHAHEDDWQLFMGNRAYNSAQSADQVVFVYVTAGDAGSVSLDYADSAYWRAREEGSKKSVEYLAGTTGWTCGRQTINTHPVLRCVLNGTKFISYFMRMPDGGAGDGTGYGNGSIELLRDRGQATSPVDLSTTYTSWADLVTTIQGIVDYESNGQSLPYVEVDAPDYDRTINPDDHPDHSAVGDAVAAATSGRQWNTAWYVDYQTAWFDTNISDAEYAIKHAEFMAYDNYMAASQGERLSDQPEYQNWQWRTYYRLMSGGQIVMAPIAPSGLTAKVVSGTQINLSWSDNSSNETGFGIERKIGGVFTQIAVTAPDATTYSDMGLTVNTAYSYRVRALSDGGNSGYTTAVSATTTLPPSGLTATGYRVSNIEHVSMTWSLGTKTTVDVYRSSTKVASAIANSGSYDDNLNKTTTGSYNYKVCIAGKTGTANCTNTVTVKF